ALAGGLFLAATDSRSMPRALATTTTAVLAVVVISSIVSGLLRFADPSLGRIAAIHGTVFESAEDEIAAVQAGQTTGGRQLWVTGTAMTLLTVDAKLMPILPLILRPQSTSAATIAFGMGSVFRA